jgi:hypothetical protein
VLAFAGGAAAGAEQEARLEAQYTMSVAGLPIGRGSWVIDISGNRYSSEANGGTVGLLRAFTGGDGKAIAHGTFRGGRPAFSTYAATISSRQKTDEIRLVVANGKVKDLKLDPPADTDPERVPITPESERGIVDPMTASMMRVAGTGNPLSSAACAHTLSIFDGRLRYDLQLAFKRMDKVKADKGYQGPVVVCAVHFMPVAGHIPSRAAIKYLSRQRNMEVWLAPIAGTRVLVPFRVQGPTPVGTAVLEATQFVALSAKATDVSKEVAKAATNGLKPD